MTGPAMTPDTMDGYLPNAKRSGGLCLALSGGGFRATLFHLGALRRLNELGLISSTATITSVSGGSIMAASLADAIMTSPPVPGQPLANFESVVDKIHKLTSYNLRRTILLKKLEPANWGHSLPELVSKELETHVTSKTLPSLPDTPRFVFVATDVVFGVDWIYSKDKAGDYEAGYKEAGLDSIKIAYATAASACFPPVFAPLDPLVKGSELKGGLAVGKDADTCRDRIRLSDGGVYDNMGLEPIWKNAETLLVSDAGGLFEYAPDRGTISDIKRYPDIMGNQARALRKRWLISSFLGGLGPGGRASLKGTYWSTASDRSRYVIGDTTGYSPDIARLIAQIRTDLDDFSGAEAAILENHGYLLADVAIKVHLPVLYKSQPPIVVPYGDWMDEKRVRDALKDSAKQRF
jgi:NTE family protein